MGARRALEGTGEFESKKCKRVVRGLSLGGEMLKRWTGARSIAGESGAEHAGRMSPSVDGVEAVETFSLHHGVVRLPLMAAAREEAARSVLVTTGSLCPGASI